MAPELPATATSKPAARTVRRTAADQKTAKVGHAPAALTASTATAANVSRLKTVPAGLSWTRVDVTSRQSWPARMRVGSPRSAA